MSPVVTAGDEPDPWTWTRSEKQKLRKIRKDVRPIDGFHYVENRYWIVKTKIDKPFTAELSLFMKLFSRRFRSLISFQHEVAKKPTVIVYGSKKRYRKKFPNGTRGFYRQDWDREGDITTFHLYTYAANEKQKSFKHFEHSILLHEGTHLLLRRILGNKLIPIMIDEGIATFFESWNLRKDVRKNLKNHWKRSENLDLLSKLVENKNLQKLDLNKLLRIKKYKNWNPDDGGPKAKLHYAAAESFIDFLFSSPETRKKFSEMFRKLKNQKRAIRMKWFSPETRKDLQKKWRKHLHNIVNSEG